MDLREAVERAPVIQKEEHMSVRTLAFGVGTIIVIALILILLAEGRRPTTVDGTQGTWGGTGGVEFWGGVAQDQNSEKTSIQDLLSGQRRDDYVSLSRTDLETQTFEEEVDFSGLLGQLLAPIEEVATPAAYDFIPRGLVGVNDTPKVETQLQQDLYRYGNDLGGFLRTFEDSHVNMLTVLKDAREDMGNTAKADAAAQIGTDYRILARDMRSMQRLPEAAKTLHASFADAHEAVGKAMETLARVKTDQEFLDAVDIYNKSVENYTEKFVALASLFAASEVTFRESDPGSVFTFRGTISSF